MRIMNRKDFLLLPENVVFSKFEPCFFRDLMIKGGTILDDAGIGIDFYAQQINDAVECDNSGMFADILFSAVETGSSFEMDFDCQGRDGMFEEKQLFAVWERKDILKLVKRLIECV